MSPVYSTLDPLARYQRLAAEAAALHVPAWAYQPPRNPITHPHQCYYRADEHNHVSQLNLAAPACQLQLYRWDDSRTARLSISWPHTHTAVELDVPTLVALRNALSDALLDIGLLTIAEAAAAASAHAWADADRRYA